MRSARFRSLFLSGLLPALPLSCAGNDDDAVGNDDDAVGDDDSTDGDPGAGCLSGSTAQGIEFIRICGGTFEMGCTAEQSSCQGDESPVHTVTLTRDFWLGTTEITQQQWQAVMGNNPSHHSSCGQDCPVENLNWYEALAFANAVSAAEGLPECFGLDDCTNPADSAMECSSVSVNSDTGLLYDCEGFRLPTEAEWEYAARAEDTLLYAGSDSIDDVGWYEGNSSETLHPVAQKQANGWGLYDMSGNVWEWGWDWYDPGYYPTSPATDPLGPGPTVYRSYRGGAWYAPAEYTRVARRNHDQPDRFNFGLGLRLVRTVP